MDLVILAVLVRQRQQDHHQQQACETSEYRVNPQPRVNGAPGIAFNDGWALIGPPCHAHSAQLHPLSSLAARHVTRHGTLCVDWSDGASSKTSCYVNVAGPCCASSCALQRALQPLASLQNPTSLGALLPRPNTPEITGHAPTPNRTLRSVNCASSMLADVESSLGDAESSLGDAKSLLGDAGRSLGDAKSSLADAESSLGGVDEFCNWLVSG